MDKKNSAAVLNLLVFIAAAFIIAENAGAVPAGKEIVRKTPMGVVVLCGTAHKGVKCDECHAGIFQKKENSSKFTMSDIKMENFCGRCHNGIRSFNASDGRNCRRCHRR